MNIEPDKPTFQRVFFGLGGSVLGVFTLAVVLGIGIFRTESRQQILQRDGVLLGNVAQYLYENTEKTGLLELDLLDVALESSEIRGVVGVRLFSPLSELVDLVPTDLTHGALIAEDQARLAIGDPVSRFYKEFPLVALFPDLLAEEALQTAPLVEVVVPVDTGKEEAASAAIQYWLDGATVAAEFASLDKTLAGMGLLFVMGGSLIFAIVFLYARTRLLSMARVLSERNRSLQRANADLAIAARTSAIGSITSHLFHDLKNPLAGLKAYLRASSGNDEVLAVADRMQSLIDETLALIRQGDSPRETRLSLEEVRQLARQRLLGKGAANPARLVFRISGDCALSLNKAQMLLLVLHNLGDNALEASPPDTPVEVEFNGSADQLQVIVRDQGPGLPETVKARLFEPVPSHKVNGTGIGLTISSMIARHIPSRLELLASNSQGTAFQITIPL